MPQKRIAIIRLSALGDIIHSLPLATSLRLHYPDSYIAWVVERKFQPLLEGNENINEVIAVDTKLWRAEIKQLSSIPYVLKKIWTFKRLLREKMFDISIDAQGLVKSSLIAVSSGAKLRIGFKSSNCREPISAIFNNCYVSFPDFFSHIVEKNCALLTPLGINSPTYDFPLAVSKKDEIYIEQFLSLNNLNKSGFVAINPGANWKTKQFKKEVYAQVCHWILDNSKRKCLLLWGDLKEKELCSQIARENSKIILAPPTDIKQLIALIKRADIFIGPDTGPMHIAAVSGIPTLGLFGPTDPKRNGPWGKIHKTVYVKLECSPCHKRECKDNYCVDLLNADIVIQTLSELMARTYG